MLFFLVPHNKTIQDAFKSNDGNKSARSEHSDRINNKVVDILTVALHENPLLVSPDANKNIVKPDFRYLKKIEYKDVL